MKKKELPVIFISPGESYFTHQQEVLLTVLGSCVAVIMYDTQSGLSGLSHCILPGKNQSADTADENDYKYVDSAIDSMLRVFNKHKIPRDRIKVKLFGGAEQMLTDNKRNLSVGEKNVNMAVEYLKSLNMQVVAKDVGGNNGRKIYLISQTGEVYLSRIGNNIRGVKYEKN